MKTGGAGRGGEEEGESEEEEGGGGGGDDGGEELEGRDADGGGPVTRHYPFIRSRGCSPTQGSVSPSPRTEERERERSDEESVRGTDWIVRSVNTSVVNRFYRVTF